MKFTLVTILLVLGMLYSVDACYCLANYSPVCATNGVTYGNSCEMGCAGAQLSHVGACEEAGGYYVV